jgi:hypothetical protein
MKLNTFCGPHNSAQDENKIYSEKMRVIFKNGSQRKEVKITFCQKRSKKNDVDLFNATKMKNKVDIRNQRYTCISIAS